jgi:hypothetical protein
VSGQEWTLEPMAEAGYELLEYTARWQPCLSWNFAVAGLMALGVAKDQRETLQMISRLREEIALKPRP